jgi:hypothetical protein
MVPKRFRLVTASLLLKQMRQGTAIPKDSRSFPMKESGAVPSKI